MATEKGCDDLLEKLEKAILKVQDSADSAVKLRMSETNLLKVVETAREMMMAAVSDKEDRDRKQMTAVFGGDCVRISRMRAYLEAIKLSDTWTTDKRLADGLSTLDIVERVLTDKGLAESLRSANARFIPFAPKRFGGGEEPAPAPAPAPQGYTAPAPAPTPVPAPAPAPPPAPEPKAAPATVQNVITDAGSGFKEVAADVKRSIMVTVSSELVPTFDFGPGGVMVMELKGINVKVNTTCEPPMPSGAKPFEENQEFFITVPEVAKVTFDPKNPDATPGGRVQAIAAGKGEVMTIPPDIDVKVGSQTMGPWGSHKLLEGKKETELQFECEVNSKFGMEELDDESTLLTIDLQVIFTGYLTGHQSAKFQPDGKPIEPPVR